MRAYAGRAVRTVLGSAVACVVVLALGLKPAAAATTSADNEFDFAPLGGSTTVHCVVHVQADFPFGTRNSGRGTTSVSGDDPACTSGVTTIVGAEYRDTTNTFVSRPYTWVHGTSVSHTWTDVLKDFQTYHQVYFPACGCATSVYVLSTPNPK